MGFELYISIVKTHRDRWEIIHFRPIHVHIVECAYACLDPVNNPTNHVQPELRDTVFIIYVNLIV